MNHRLSGGSTAQTGGRFPRCRVEQLPKRPALTGERQCPRLRTQALVTTQCVKGLQNEGGTVRSEALANAVKGVGGQLESFDFGFGDHDVLVIADFPATKRHRDGLGAAEPMAKAARHPPGRRIVLRAARPDRRPPMGTRRRPSATTPRRLPRRRPTPLRASPAQTCPRGGDVARRRAAARHPTPAPTRRPCDHLGVPARQSDRELGGQAKRECDRCDWCAQLATADR